MAFFTYVFQLNGVTKSIEPGWSIKESANGGNRMECAILLPKGTGRPSLDDAVTFTENGTLIFAGLIDRLQESGLDDGIAGSRAIVVHLSIADYNVYANRIRYTGDIAAGTYKAFLTIVAAELSAQGVTLDAAQVTGPSLPALSYVDAPIVDMLNEASALSDGYVWNINYSKVLSGFLPGSVTAPFNITDGDRNCLGDITVEQPRQADYANYVTVMGGEGQQFVNDNLGTGNNIKTIFNVNYNVAQYAGYVNQGGSVVNGVIVGGFNQTLGDPTTATWTYVPGVGPAGLGLLQYNLSPPPAPFQILFPYMAQFPLAVSANGGAPAASRIQKTYRYPKIFNEDVLSGLATTLLARDMESPKTVRYKAALSKTGLHPGQVQTIASTKRNLSGSHLITDVQIQHLTGPHVQRSVTAVSTIRLPITLRESFQQTFGGGTAGKPVPPLITGTGFGGSGTPGTLGSVPNSITLYGQAGPWGVSNYLTVPPVAGEQVGFASEITGSASGTPKWKIAGYFAAQSAAGGDDIIPINVIAQWNAGDPASNVIALEIDLNNNKADCVANQTPYVHGIRVISGATKVAGTAIAIGSTSTGQWRKGIEISGNPYHAWEPVLDVGIEVGGPSAATLIGSGVFRQLTNGGDTLLLQRRTNTTPTGFLIRALDASANPLFSVSVAGSMTMPAAGASIEIGDATSTNTPFFDFHSSNNANDYDTRVLASGGGAGNGLGTLTVTAANFATSSKITERGRSFGIGEWINYTPTFTNITVGNGTLAAKYTQVGNVTFVELTLVFGSTTTIAAAATVSTPTNTATVGGQTLGTIGMYDASAFSYYTGTVFVNTASTGLLTSQAAPMVAVGATVPFTWTTSDQLTLRLCYQNT